MIIVDHLVTEAGSEAQGRMCEQSNCIFSIVFATCDCQCNHQL